MSALSIVIYVALKAGFRPAHRGGLMPINEKTQLFAVLSCSGTQD